MTRALLTVAILLAGCGVSLPERTYTPNADDVTAFMRVDAAWQAAGLDSLDTERCAELRQYMRVVIADDDTFSALCSYCPPGNCPGYRASNACPWGCAAECFTTPCAGSWPHCWGEANAFLGGHEHALIVVHESRAPNGYPDPALVRHGYLHYLGQCSGRGADPGHRDAAMWRLDR